MSKFEYAKMQLRETAEAIDRREGKNNDEIDINVYKRMAAEVHSAIAVLEAAERVKRKKALLHLDWNPMEYGVYDLIEAIPEEE